MWAELILGLPRPRVVALVGGGGKTSLMAWIYEELTRRGFLVVATTTTKLSIDEPRGFFYVKAHSLAQAARLLGESMPVSKRVALVRDRVADHQDKMKGIPPDWVDALAEKFPDVIFLVEADGAAGFSLKGHLSHEPVIPPSTRLVIPVVGMDGLEKMPSQDSVHRLDRFYELAGLRQEESITTTAVVKVLFHPEGYLRGTPADARIVPFLNKVESLFCRFQATKLQEAIRAWRHPQLAGVVSGSVFQGSFTFEPAEISQVAGVILAAGASLRMGTFKQLLMLKGEPLLRVVAREALRSRLGEVLVVTGAMQDETVKVLAGLPVRLVANPYWMQGQSTSVVVGMGTIAPEMKAALFMLVDQLLVGASLVDRVIAAYTQTGATIVAPRCGQRIGNPVLFDRETWQDELLALSGDEGARRILREHAEDVHFVEVAEEEVFLDIDTPEDYEKVRRLWMRSWK